MMGRGRAEVEIVRNLEPLMVRPSSTVMTAAKEMRSRNISAALIIEEDARLVGIFTERDAIARVLAEGKDPTTTTMAEVMTDNPDAVRPDDGDDEVVRLMQRGQCRHLPIVHQGKAVGIVSRGDFRRLDDDAPAGR